jgi:hypothetical protein
LLAISLSEAWRQGVKLMRVHARDSEKLFRLAAEFVVEGHRHVLQLTNLACIALPRNRFTLFPEGNILTAQKVITLRKLCLTEAGPIEENMIAPLVPCQVSRLINILARHTLPVWQE